MLQGQRAVQDTSTSPVTKPAAASDKPAAPHGQRNKHLEQERDPSNQRPVGNQGIDDLTNRLHTTSQPQTEIPRTYVGNMATGKPFSQQEHPQCNHREAWPMQANGKGSDVAVPSAQVNIMENASISENVPGRTPARDHAFAHSSKGSSRDNQHQGGSDYSSQKRGKVAPSTVLGTYSTSSAEKSLHNTGRQAEAQYLSLDALNPSRSSPVSSLVSRQSTQSRYKEEVQIRSGQAETEAQSCNAQPLTSSLPESEQEHHRLTAVAPGEESSQPASSINRYSRGQQEFQHGPNVYSRSAAQQRTSEEDKTSGFVPSGQQAPGLPQHLQTSANMPTTPVTRSYNSHSSVSESATQSRGKQMLDHSQSRPTIRDSEKQYLTAAQRQRERVERIRKAQQAARVIQRAWRNRRK